MSGVIGVDFGTTNTFCSYARRNPDGNLQLSPVKLQDGFDSSFPTALLYKLDGNGKITDCFVGREAEDEWVQIPPEEHSNYRYVSNFKPDLAASAEAHNHAKVFLTALAEAIFQPHSLRGFPLSPEQQVIIGVPATTIKDHARLTRATAEEAGFKVVDTVPEPLGALIFHLNSKELELRHSRSSVLVIDFGGGTCDFAFLVRGQCQSAWGDPLYGGRLFDDMFFQWLCETNPTALHRMTASGDEPVVHWLKCRKAKEAFSKAMARNRDTPFTYADFMGHGALRRITWNEFLDKSSQYTPSDGFISTLQASGDLKPKWIHNKTLDLIGHFEACLRDGLEKYHIRASDIDFVILAGGSSLWPFVMDVLIDNLHVPRDRIKQSANPQETIGSGLALYPLIKEDANTKKTGLTIEKGKKAEDLKAIVKEEGNKFANDLAKELSSVFVNEHIDPLFKTYADLAYQWSIAELEEALKRQASDFSRRAEGLIDQRQREFDALTMQRICDFIDKWLSEYQIRWDSQFSTGRGSLTVSAPETNTTDTVIVAIGAIAAVITGAVGAAVCGGGGLALIMTGPIGLIIGAVIGVAVAVLAVYYGWDASKDMIKNVPIPKVARSVILPKAMSPEQREQVESAWRNELVQNLEAATGDLSKQVERLIEQVICDIDWIHVL